MEIASKGQLRLAYLRWAFVTVPFVLLLGFASARFAPTGSENSWYLALAKPGFMPPEWAFPAAWTILYVLMGFALAIVLNARRARGRVLALIVFAVQLLVNLAWSPVFFGMRNIPTALILIASLVLLVIVTILLFARVRSLAGLLLLPYLAWICFAGYLLFSIHQLNPNAATLVPSGATDQILIR